MRRLTDPFTNLCGRNIQQSPEDGKHPEPQNHRGGLFPLSDDRVVPERAERRQRHEHEFNPRRGGNFSGQRRSAAPGSHRSIPAGGREREVLIPGRRRASSRCSRASTRGQTDRQADRWRHRQAAGRTDRQAQLSQLRTDGPSLTAEAHNCDAPAREQESQHTDGFRRGAYKIKLRRQLRRAPFTLNVTE